jgi:hypothetical protein
MPITKHELERALGREWISPGQAAKALDLSAPRVRELAVTGQLSTVMLPTGDRLIERRSVERLAQERASKRA